MRFCAACHGFRAAPAPKRMSRGYGLRQTDRTVGFPLVQGADMASLRTADAVLQGKPADRTDLDRLPHSLVLTYCSAPPFTGPHKVQSTEFKVQSS